MTNLLDFILECILLGTVGSISSRRVPMFLRVLLALALSGVCLGFSGLLFYVGLRTGSITVSAAAFLVLIAAGVLILPRIKQLKNK